MMATIFGIEREANEAGVDQIEYICCRMDTDDTWTDVGT
jgi:hypothetical protein